MKKYTSDFCGFKSGKNEGRLLLWAVWTEPLEGDERGLVIFRVLFLRVFLSAEPILNIS